MNIKNTPFLIERPMAYIFTAILAILLVSTTYFAYLAYRPAESTTVTVNIAPEEMARIEAAAKQVTAGIAEQREIKASNEAVLAKLKSLEQELATKLATVERRRHDIELDRELDKMETAGYKRLAREVAVRELIVSNIKRREGSEFTYRFTDRNEYFGWLLEQFQLTTNQSKMGHYADIMAGMYEYVHIYRDFFDRLNSVRCPGNDSPLIEYLEYLNKKGKAEPIPANVKLATY